MTIRKVVTFLLILLTVACKPVIAEPVPPTPYPIHVAITPALQPVYQDTLQRCAAEIPEAAMILDVLPGSSLEQRNAEIAIRIGEPLEGVPGFTAHLGWEEIVIVVQHEVNFEGFDIEKIRDLYTESPPAYNIWTYPEGDELRQVFDTVVLKGAKSSPYGMLAPNPGAMLESVSRDSQAIGYLPKSWVTDEVQIVPLDVSIQKALRQPILALTGTEPEGPVRAFLICVQNSQE